MVSWEKDQSAPLTTALVAWADAGADALYILTGKRAPAERGDPGWEMMEVALDDIERDLLEPGRNRRPGETEEGGDRRTLDEVARKLSNILQHDAPAGMPEPLVARAKALSEAAADPVRRAMLQTADFVQKNQRREDERELLQIWLGVSTYEPDESVMKLLVDIALEYRVPHRTLAELADAIWQDIEEERSAEAVIALHERETAKRRRKKASD